MNVHANAEANDQPCVVLGLVRRATKKRFKARAAELDIKLSDFADQLVTTALDELPQFQPPATEVK